MAEEYYSFVEDLGKLISKHYGKGKRFIDERIRTKDVVYTNGSLTEGLGVRFDAGDPSIFAVFSIDELKHLKQIK